MLPYFLISWKLPISKVSFYRILKSTQHMFMLVRSANAYSSNNNLFVVTTKVIENINIFMTLNSLKASTEHKIKWILLRNLAVSSQKKKTTEDQLNNQLKYSVQEGNHISSLKSFNTKLAQMKNILTKTFFVIVFWVWQNSVKCQCSHFL